MRYLLIPLALAAVLESKPLGISQAPRESMVVSTTWLASHLKDDNLVLLHLGVKTDYDAGHIPGARFITLNDIAVSDTTSDTGLSLQMPAADDLRTRLEALGIADTSRVVVSYGRDRIAMATRVLYTLDYAGLGRQASLLDGGSDAWVKDGRPMTTDVPPAASGKLSPLKVQQTVVDANFVNDQREKPGFVVIDGRLAGFFSGAQTGGSPQRPHRTGHIAGARNVPCTETLDADQKLKPAEALAALFSAAGAKPGDTVVAYCHIGQQATAVAFAARTLGFKVVLYDGSFEDWSRRLELPVKQSVEEVTHWLETPRLLLRRFTEDDRAWLGDLYADLEVTRYLGGPQTPDAVDRMLRDRILDYYDAHPGLGIWMTIERDTGERAGFHLLNNIQGESIIQVGFTLTKRAWGRGYGTEMASAVLRHGFATLGLQTIAGMASLRNLASQRVLEKIGLERRGERAFPHPAYASEGPMAWFERDAEDWLAERRS